MYNHNPTKMAVQKFMSELMRDRYPYHHNILERICHYLVTEQDVKQFGSLVTELYQLGFHRATKEYSQKLAEQGYKLEIVTEESKKTDDDQMDNM